ncbi:peptidase S9 [Novosphingobium sp. PC22D]|uniref:S9 family peptidase n=1 Tax=Novosphingobium sp. PC22D TaxID=1962403 RepID=UPI000BF134A0|nr:prolyl oligopeptidase family serine peptidase [Novosphingobium sp. PC22D]PEQ14334.1 peptidase S9 [Novosphingobium sp. PC22D]
MTTFPKAVAALWLALLLALVPARAADVGDLAEALAMPVSSGLVGAEEAERFAWVVNAGGVRNIHVGGPDLPARQATRYTADDGMELYELAWSRDGRRLAFTRGGDAEFPDGTIPNPGHLAEPPRQEVLVMAVPGGAPHVIGEGHAPVFGPDGTLAFTRKGEIWLWRAGREARKVANVDGTISRLQFSPDGKRLLFQNDRGDHAFVGLFEIGARHLRYLGAGLSYSVEPVFSPDGAQVAFIRFVSPPAGGDDGSASYWSIVVADLSSGSARVLWRAPAGEGGSYYGTRQRNLYWTAQGKLIFPSERDGWLHVYALDARAGGTPRLLTPGRFEVETFLPTRDGKGVIVVANVDETDRHVIWSAPVAGGPMIRAAGASQGSESFPVLAGDAMAYIATGPTRPAHVILANVGPMGPVAELEGAAMPEPVTFRAGDGVTVHGQLFAGAGPGPHPALVFVHGGPRRQMLTGFHPMGYYSNAYVLNQHLAAKGYTVLSVNYRSGTGYGRAFREAPETGRDGASEYRDVLAGGRWLAARGDVDPRRIGIWGGSWGGYLSALALARDSELFAAGVDFHGVHTMLRDPSDSLSPEAQAKARDLQWQSSPFGALDSWRSPVLLIHGDDDRNVDFGQSLLLARELAARQVPFEELVFPDERHEFFRHADWLASYRATVDFLDRKLMNPEATP